MLRSLIALALLCIAASQPAAPPATWPLQRFVRWSPNWGSRDIRAAGLQARIELKQCGVDRSASEGCSEGDRYPVATVRGPGMRPISLTGEPGVGAFVGIGKLTPNATRPSLILISEDGGSAGCVQIDLAVPSGGAYRSVRLSIDKNDRGTLCEVEPSKLAWPNDMAGDGRPAFRLLDTAFHCRFTSCAGSWYPPRIVAFDGERGIDVSDNAVFRPLFKADMAKARQACMHDKDEAQGPCAAYAADAARLGRLPQAWRVIDEQVRRGCRVPVSNGCPDINRIPATFPGELAVVLRRAGYR